MIGSVARSEGKRWMCFSITPAPHLAASRQLPPLRLLSHIGGKQRVGYRRNAVTLSASTNDDPVAATAPPTTSIAAAELPTVFERFASALMFLLPLSEGAFRISLSFVHFCKQQALEFMYWCHHQHRQVSLALAARTVTDISKDDVVRTPVYEKLHQWFSNWSIELTNLSRPVQQLRDTALGSGWLSATIGTPEAIWQLGCLLYMSVLAALAAFKLNRLSKGHRPSNQLTLFFRKPQVVTVSYFCALLMRMSWSPMEGMSDLSLDIYWIPATVLTFITTVVAAAQMHTLLFARLPKIAQFLENMAREVTMVAQLHRTFLLGDWLLCLFSSVSFDGKCLRSVLLLIYWKTVSALEGAAQSAKQSSTK